MCDFKQLYCGIEGYVFRCNQCGYYQIGFSSLMITLSETDYQCMYESVIIACRRVEYFEDDYLKQIVLPTPYPGVNIFLNVLELKSFTQMLDAANNEIVSLEFINMFESNRKH
ncbi:MAG: hypothetical protein PW786_02600 [Arachidicoccus sp.]|nr:hypothetical protein [Arachidicoccus sp.]